MTAEKFRHKHKPIAVLVEGKFRSLFQYRNMGDVSDRPFKGESEYSRTIVISDGDMIRNKVYGVGENVRPVPLGYDEYSGQMYGNRDFLLNCINWLCDDDGWMQLRGRNLAFYMLDKTRLKSERSKWEMINLLIPLAFVVTGGVAFVGVRRRKYRKTGD